MTKAELPSAPAVTPVVLLGVSTELVGVLFGVVFHLMVRLPVTACEPRRLRQLLLVPVSVPPSLPVAPVSRLDPSVQFDRAPLTVIVSELAEPPDTSGGLNLSEPVKVEHAIVSCVTSIELPEATLEVTARPASGIAHADATRRILRII